VLPLLRNTQAFFKKTKTPSLKSLIPSEITFLLASLLVLRAFCFLPVKALPLIPLNLSAHPLPA